jgi:hypothetical protein
MKRCLSTGNLDTTDSFITVAHGSKKAKKQRQKLQKELINSNQPVNVDANDCVPMSQADMDSVIESVINPNSMSILSAVSHCVCDQLKAEMSSMQNTITELNSRVVVIPWLG